MKRTFLFILICLLVNISYSQTYTFAFTASDFSIVEHNGEHKINAPTEFLSASKICTPILPSCIKRILLPPNKKVSSYTVTYNTENWQNNILLKAMPVSYPTDGKIYPNVSCSYDLKVYPDSIVRYGGVSTIDHYRCVGFVITPFVYNATNGSLSLVTQVNISLDLVDDVANHSVLSVRDRVVKQLVHNPEDISRFYPQKAQRSSTQNIDYLIITKNSLKESFEPLRIWKTQKGIYTKIVTVEEIDSVYANQWETQPLRIKQCIQEYYASHGLQWVLLGGDETIIPAVYAYAEVDTCDGGCPPVIDYIPSDVFYGCFEGAFDWNANGNNIIGELTDNVDLNQNASISRLPINSNQQAEAYIGKLLAYEQSPSIKRSSLLACANKLSVLDLETNYSDAHIKTDNQINSAISNVWDGAIRKFYDTYTDFYGGASYDLNVENLTTQLNHNYTFLHFAAHGNANRWAIEGDNYYTSNNVLELTNSTPMVIATTACHTNAFDLAEPCLSEAFIRKPIGGAIVYWGSSRYGWSVRGCDPLIADPSFVMNSIFLLRLLDNEKMRHFSDIAKYVRLNFSFYADWDDRYRWLLFSNNAIGDAEVPIYTTVPSEFKHVTITKNLANVVVNTGGVDSCTITISNVANGGNYYVTETNVAAATFTSVPNDYTIVITKDNYIPYVYDPNAPQPICHITNEIINDELVVMGCEETKIGGHPRIDIEIQTRGVDSGVLVPMDSIILIPFLRGEVKITNTGSLEVINGGTVNIEHLTMEEGAELKIH